MGAPALAPPRAPAPRSKPARRRKPARRARPASARGSGAKRRPNRALASQAGPRQAGSRPRRRASKQQRRHRVADYRGSQGIAQPALAGAALIPQAAVSAAGAVRDLSDSSLIVRLTRGRGWIGLLCFLLGGIVALNVISLSLNAGSGRVSQRVSELERSNSALRAELATELSASRIEAAAAAAGLAVPPPEDVSYLNARDGDLSELASLLADDAVLAGEAPASSTAPAPAPTVEPAPASAAPASGPSAPAANAPAAPAPAAPSPGATGGVGL